MKYFFALIFALTFVFGKSQMDEKFYFPGKVLKPITDLQHQAFSFTNENETLSAIHFIPAKKAKVSVLFFHGSGGNITSYLFMIKPLVEAGFNVYAVDFRGYGNSTGKPTHQNIAADAQIFFDRITARKEAKNTKIVLYGASIGTLVASNVARNNSDKIDAVVLDGTVSSLQDLAAVYAPQYVAQLNEMFAPLYSPEKDLQKLPKLPKLFIASKEDKEVPFEQTIKVFEKVPDPKFLREYEGKHLEALKNVPDLIISDIKKLISTP